MRDVKPNIVSSVSPNINHCNFNMREVRDTKRIITLEKEGSIRSDFCSRSEGSKIAVRVIRL